MGGKEIKTWKVKMKNLIEAFRRVSFSRRKIFSIVVVGILFFVGIVYGFYKFLFLPKQLQITGTGQQMLVPTKTVSPAKIIQPEVYQISISDFPEGRPLSTALDVTLYSTTTLPGGGADLHLYDGRGWHTGYNYQTGQIDEDVSGSVFGDVEPKKVVVSQPRDESYNIQIVGKSREGFTLKVEGIANGEVINSATYTGEVLKGEVLTSVINVSTLKIRYGPFNIEGFPLRSAPVIEVTPEEIELSANPGETAQGTLIVRETGGNQPIQDVKFWLFEDLSGPGGDYLNVIIEHPRLLDIAPGGEYEFLVEVPLKENIALGNYYGFLTLGSANAAARAIPITVQIGVIPAPNFYPIENPDEDGNYVLRWSRVEEAIYIVVEDTNADFSNLTSVYYGLENSTSITAKKPGTYYYRVQASGDRGSSDWSNIESVVVAK